LIAIFPPKIWAEPPAAESKPRALQPLSADDARALFAARIAPLLKTKCAGCHGDDPKQMSGQFDVRSREKLLAGGESGAPALVPGDAGRSPLWVAATWDDPDLQMPPQARNRLSADELADLKRWIESGAPWPNEPALSGTTKWDTENARDGIVVATSGGLSPDWTQRKYQPAAIWAFQPLARPQVPAAVDPISPGTAEHPLDAFVRARLRAQGFSAAPPADGTTLLRRLTWDLTGLPPTKEELDSFLKDTSPAAYARLVERLLASPHYGEQQARHWLDVVRYADTGGFSNDFERPNAWRYRDYVIRSLQADLPFDRFLTEQLAGDELAPENPEMLISVGFLRMGPWEQTGMSVAAVTRQQFLDDVTHAVGVTFLGQGLRCAQCHDHKFDPIPTRDYYGLQAAFAPVQFAERDAAFLPSENTHAWEAPRARLERLLAESQAVLNELKRKQQGAVEAWLKERQVARVEDLPVEQRPPRHLGLSTFDLSLDKVYKKRIEFFERELLRYRPLALSLYNGPQNNYSSNRAINPLPGIEKRQGKPAEVRILLGGSLEAQGDLVGPSVLSAVFVTPAPANAPAWDLPRDMTGRRLALARWLTGPARALTARVIVNRVWQSHFGRGIVATPNNFGKMGARPTHPELLDWLAGRLLEHDWSLRDLHRLIVTSETYRQASTHPQASKLLAVDAKNDWLAYYPPRRLASEEIRDGMLALSGELNRTQGGVPAYPELNWEVALQPRHIMGSVAPAYQPAPTREARNRRTIYAFRCRTLPDPMQEVFNRPGSDASCERRDESTVAPQAFTLFNGPFTQARALSLAHRIAQAQANPAKQIEEAFEIVLCRKPSDEERRACKEHLARLTEHHRTHRPSAIELPKETRREMIEEMTGESFSWVETLDQMRDYQPDLQPNEVPAETRALAEICLVLLNTNEFLYIR